MIRSATTGAFIHAWRRITWRDRALLCEAMVLLALASFAISVTRFRFVARTAAWGRRETLWSPGERRVISRRVRWAVLACARRVPWRAVCFQQGLTAHWMLRRRGISSVLYYGAAPDDAKRLAAHVWVRDGELDVVGGEVSSRFAVLATFPRQSGQSS